MISPRHPEGGAVMEGSNRGAQNLNVDLNMICRGLYVAMPRVPLGAVELRVIEQVHDVRTKLERHAIRQPELAPDAHVDVETRIASGLYLRYVRTGGVMTPVTGIGNPDCHTSDPPSCQPPAITSTILFSDPIALPCRTAIHRGTCRPDDLVPRPSLSHSLAGSLQIVWAPSHRCERYLAG